MNRDKGWCGRPGRCSALLSVSQSAPRTGFRVSSRTLLFVVIRRQLKGNATTCLQTGDSRRLTGVLGLGRLVSHGGLLRFYNFFQSHDSFFCPLNAVVLFMLTINPVYLEDSFLLSHREIFRLTFLSDKQMAV